MEPRFIVDINVGKLAKWLRIMGYDTLFIKDIDDSQLVQTALEGGRVILTKDTQIMRRRLVTSGRLRVILIEADEVRAQLSQVMRTLQLDRRPRPFSLCLECNQALVPRSRDEVRDLVPPYVFQTRSQYVECPSCHRIYWQGTHWQRMSQELADLWRGL